TAVAAPRTTLLPYTTLFRSRARLRKRKDREQQDDELLDGRSAPSAFAEPLNPLQKFSQLSKIAFCGETLPLNLRRTRIPDRVTRSEEHTSELQSLRHLVCRL